MKILYCPIYEPGGNHTIAVENKRGLLWALQKVAEVREIDYLDIPIGELDKELRFNLNDFRPDMLFTQLHGADRLTEAQAAAIRRDYPNMLWANLSGDVWQPTDEFKRVLAHAHVQLINNASWIPEYAAAGVNAVFWPLGYEPPVREYPDVAAHDVVYLGNNYSDKRKQLYNILRSLPYNVGIYGNGWEQADGVNYYDTTAGDALYKRAKLTVSDQQWPEALGYLGNRPQQAMFAGCFVLHQYTDQLTQLTGLIDGAHLVMFRELDELPTLISEWLAKDDERQRIAEAGQWYTTEYLSWDMRVMQLLQMLERV